MPYLVGTDEAGYGPNLGPLAITATVWHIPDDDMGIDLYRRLGTVARPSDPANRASSKLLFGDSKKLYTPGGGLAKLERGVLAAIYALPRHLPTTWRGLFQFCDVESLPQLDELIWYRDFDRPLPVAISRQQADDETRQLQPALEGAGVRLIDIQSRVVFPSRYNEYVERCDSKGLALSEWTLQLVRQVIEPLGAGNRLRSVRQTRRSKSLCGGTPAHLFGAFPGSAAGIAAGERLSLGSSSKSCRDPFHGQGGAISANGARVDGLQVLARIGHGRL